MGFSDNRSFILNSMGTNAHWLILTYRPLRHAFGLKQHRHCSQGYSHARRTSQVWYMVHFFYPAGANPTGQAAKWCVQSTEAGCAALEGVWAHQVLPSWTVLFYCKKEKWKIKWSSCFFCTVLLFGIALSVLQSRLDKNFFVLKFKRIIILVLYS